MHIKIDTVNAKDFKDRYSYNKPDNRDSGHKPDEWRHQEDKEDRRRVMEARRVNQSIGKTRTLWCIILQY